MFSQPYLEKFHGHFCDGLVVGALAFEQAMLVLYPNQLIDRTNLRIVSKPLPCQLNYLKTIEDQFAKNLVQTKTNNNFLIKEITSFQWNPSSKNNYLKTDILNKNLPNSLE